MQGSNGCREILAGESGTLILAYYLPTENAVELKKLEMQLKKIVIFALLVSLSASCTSYYESILRSTDPEVKYKAAFEYYNNKKYRRSAEIFESLVLLMQGMPQEDTVQFYNAMSNYNMKDFVTAESNFDKFATVFPRSPFYEKARFLRLECLYQSTYRYELDQTPTRKAMSAITEFMYDYPSSEHFAECEKMMEDLMERLDKKSYESAKLYYRIEDYQAAHYALKNVLRENSENIYRKDVMYLTAMASYKYALHSVREKQKERYLTFIDDYYNFIGEYPDAVERKELDGLYVKALTFTKGADVEEQYESGALTKEERKKMEKQNKAAVKEVKKAEKMRMETDKKHSKKEVNVEKTAESK